MQLFRLHKDHEQNARAYPDKYTYNQIRESEQFLRYALHNKLNFEYPGFPVNENNRHLKHPLTLWAGSSKYAWMEVYWVTKYAHDEWKRRYSHPGKKIHKSWARIEDMKEVAWDLPATKPELQPCPFDNVYKVHTEPQTMDQVVENYRNYILMYKSKKEWFKYVKADPPAYIRPYLSE